MAKQGDILEPPPLAMTLDAIRDRVARKHGLLEDVTHLLRAVEAMRPFLEQEVRGCSDECPRPCGHQPAWDVLKMLDAPTPPTTDEGHDG